MSKDGTLEALRLADSFLPIGGYAASYGLEQFIQSGQVTNADELESLLETHLSNLMGRADLVALRSAHASARDDDLDGVCEADWRLSAVTMAAEFRESSESEGNRLLTLQCDLVDEKLLDAYADRVDVGDVPGNYPIVLGMVTSLSGVDEQNACLIGCHGFVTRLLGAAQRLMSLGHTDAQRILRGLQPTIHEAVVASGERSIERLAPFAPIVDVLSAEHERAERRLFVS